MISTPTRLFVGIIRPACAKLYMDLANPIDSKVFSYSEGRCTLRWRRPPVGAIWCMRNDVPGVKAREKAVPWPPSPRILWPLATKLLETFGKYVSKCFIALKSLAGVVGNTCRNSEVDSMMTTITITDSGSPTDLAQSKLL